MCSVFYRHVPFVHYYFRVLDVFCVLQACSVRSPFFFFFFFFSCFRYRVPWFTGIFRSFTIFFRGLHVVFRGLQAYSVRSLFFSVVYMSRSVFYRHVPFVHYCFRVLDVVFRVTQTCTKCHMIFGPHVGVLSVLQTCSLCSPFCKHVHCVLQTCSLCLQICSGFCVLQTGSLRSVFCKHIHSVQCFAHTFTEFPIFQTGSVLASMLRVFPV